MERALGGARAAGAASSLGALPSGTPSNAAAALGGLGSAAGAGAGIYGGIQAATNDDLNTGQRTIAGAQAATAVPAAMNAAASAGVGSGAASLGALGPILGSAGGYLAAAMLTDFLVNKSGFKESSNPVVAANAKGVEGLVKPRGVQGLLSGHTGSGAGKQFLSDLFGQTPFLSAFGVWDGPTSKGGKFRTELNSVINEMDFAGNLDVSGKYELSPEEFDKYSDDAKRYATTLGAVLTGLTSRRGDRDYQIQAQNVLLNNLGEDVVGKGKAAFEKLGLTPKDAFSLIAEDFSGDRNQLADLARNVNIVFGRDPEMDLDL